MHWTVERDGTVSDRLPIELPSSQTAPDTSGMLGDIIVKAEWLQGTLSDSSPWLC